MEIQNEPGRMQYSMCRGWGVLGGGRTRLDTETILSSIYYYVGFRTGFLFGLVRFHCWVSVSLGLALEWPLHVGKVC